MKKRFGDLAAGIDGLDPCKPDDLADLRPPTAHTKSFTEIEADFSAAGKVVPPMVKEFAAIERGNFDEAQLAGLRVVWRSRKIS